MTDPLTVSQVAALLSLSPRQVRHLAGAGAFPGAWQAGEGPWLIPQAAVDAYLRAAVRTGEPGRPPKVAGPEDEDSS